MHAYLQQQDIFSWMAPVFPVPWSCLLFCPSFPIAHFTPFILRPCCAVPCRAALLPAGRRHGPAKAPRGRVEGPTDVCRQLSPPQSFLSQAAQSSFTDINKPLIYSLCFSLNFFVDISMLENLKTLAAILLSS